MMDDTMPSQNLSPEYAHALRTHEDVVLLESTRLDQENNRNLLFIEPLRTLQISRASEFATLLQRIQESLEQGYYVAGFFSYECGYHLEKLGLTGYHSERQPLAWFGVYASPLIFEHKEPAATSGYEMLDEEMDRIERMRFHLDPATYRQKIEQIREYIRAGDVYQINFTGRYHFDFAGEPFALYNTLKHKQQTGYSAYIRAAGQHILSFSPELFFRVEGESIITRPMKGTAPRGCTLAEDQLQREWLQHDRKNRAENVMIVDLLRNDLGRVCEIGSVRAPQLFTIEQYETLLQMTSTVTGTLKKLDYEQILRSLFPCGSITGAPKIRAMEIIKELEDTPRGVYTGAIGYFSPLTKASMEGHRAAFNVAIRTIVLKDGAGEMGVGSGIVFDSDAESEYTECLVKAHFLTSGVLDFEILEALLWENGYHFLEKHLRRMADSATYFAYPFERTMVEALLAQEEGRLKVGCTYKIRLRLNRAGRFHCERSEIPTGAPTKAVVALSPEHTNSKDRFYYHKTTHRPLYERATAFAQKHGYTDMLFLNERGELTEGAINNLFIERAGLLLTPPLHCGLLNGIARQRLLEENPLAREEVLHLEDLQQAEKIYLCNSIRGVREVELSMQEPRASAPKVLST